MTTNETRETRIEKIAAAISVWMDTTSNPGAPKWIVSIDDDDCTETQHICDTEEAAVDCARTLSRRTGLSYEYDGTEYVTG